jgi:excisionase family DNA binding protein
MRIWLNVAEAADYAGVCRDTIYTAVERGELRHVRMREDATIEVGDLFAQMLIQRLQHVAAVRGVRGKHRLTQHRLPRVAPQGRPPAHPMAQRETLEGVHHPRTDAHPLMAVQEQRAQVPELGRRDPDRGKSIFDEQPQEQRRVSPIMFLLTGFGLADPRGMADPIRNAQLLEEV